MTKRTDLFYYTGHGWTPATLIETFIFGTDGINQFCIYVPALETSLNVPAMAVKVA